MSACIMTFFLMGVIVTAENDYGYCNTKVLEDENGITIQTNGPTKITIENQPDPAPGNIG